ncbi:NAF1-domain-containing protein [Fomitiporia mediterranea MF3/22]|uniref:NAF1-domain-containing protein n=1 Tax=Fomitiporia mediterranea (strain MF3/22) TaxID=694068 RepID=UPI00044072F3|nr:NAF1-domain-containing protein [Fomitiporia mediterranea MF3/22]EJC98727.1 NAF1-domain-containing protein [Fomitiporia mediterranea MF3/22]
MFKVPSSIPQDLLLIHDIVSEPIPGPSSVKPRTSEDAKTRSESSNSIDSSSASSDSETDSEEVDAVESLLIDPDALVEVVNAKPRSPSPSSSESSSDDSSSDGDSDAEEKTRPVTTRKPVVEDYEDDDEDEHDSRLPSSSSLRTKNELVDSSVTLPEITEIDPQEPLEKVGEIMSIIENVVVVKGLASQNENKASERALDSESLLVFEDRKVLGYIHETFGPTYQPLYQVKFSSAASIDKSMMSVGREVFHAPRRSHFVFPSQLRKMKGSDASNVHDEEVNEDEMEFSDDEAEAAYRQQRKRKREGYRESSVSSSRFSTPTPTQMRDQELKDSSFYNASPYDEYGPYDIDSAPGPSRPAPLPYDDPYQDVPVAPSESGAERTREERSRSPSSPRSFMPDRSRGRGRGRGYDRGRGRGRGREHGGGRGGFRGRRPSGETPWAERQGSRPRSYSRSDSRSLSPTSMAIARATGQFADNSAFPSQLLSPSSPSTSTQGYWQRQQENTVYGQYTDPSQHQAYGGSSAPQMSSYDQQSQNQNYSQPHINPRFASLFAMNMNFMQGQQYNAYAAPNSPVASPYSAYSPNSSWEGNAWTQSGPQGNASGSGTQPDGTNEYAVQMTPETDEYRP